MRYIHYPKNISRGRYDAAFGEYIRGFGALPEVQALWRYGGVRNPGISDLDILAVLKKDLRESGPEQFVIDSRRFPISASLPQGTLMLMHEREFSRIHWFDAGIRLDRLWGSRDAPKEISKAWHSERLRASIIDWLPYYLARLIALARAPSCDVIFCLRFLRAYGFTFEHLYELAPRRRYKQFVERVRDLRDYWRTDKAQELRDLMAEGIDLGFSALRAEADVLCSRSGSGASGFVSLGRAVRFEFAPKNACREDTARMHDGRVVLPIPREYAAHFACYAECPGMLAAEMRRGSSLPRRVPIGKRDRAYLKRKMAIATRAALFLQRNGFSKGLFRFGFYYL
ncbi:MAG: hypothetical protein HY472_00755 [Candidatus Sungbacteria bacterium]|nr:hypothetical protein [Candidatus Sungbacteria bacterium]